MTEVAGKPTEDQPTEAEVIDRSEQERVINNVKGSRALGEEEGRVDLAVRRSSVILVMRGDSLK